jgi:hypothetical protein
MDRRHLTRSLYVEAPPPNASRACCVAITAAQHRRDTGPAIRGGVDEITLRLRPARVRASRQRRDHVIAVVGEKEVVASEVQVVDVSAGFRGSVPRSDLVDLLSRSYADRGGNIDWPRNASASAAPV